MRAGNNGADHEQPKPVVNQETQSSHVNKTSKDVMETQTTTCQINTEQLVATAEATVTRVLKGLVTSSKSGR